MRFFLPLLFFLSFAGSSPSWAEPSVKQATDGDQFRALEAADDSRLKAFLSPTRQALEELFSADLQYAHSNGLVDSRDSLVEALVSGKTRYLEFDYTRRDFRFASPEIALMSGRARLQVSGLGDSKTQLELSFLGVWRKEGGSWRFLAWQSCRLPAAVKP